MKEPELSYIAGGNVNYTTLERFVSYTVEFVPTALLHIGVYPREIKTDIHNKTCTRISIEALFKMVKNRTQPKFPLPGKWMNGLWYIYKMEYYSAIKRKKLLDKFQRHYPERRKPAPKE